MKTSIFLKVFGSALLAASLLNCGGGGGSGGSSDNSENGSPPPSPVIKQGQFIDSAVQGLKYVSGNQSGITDTNGTFSYEDGTKVKFSMADISLGEGQGKQVISPIDLVPGATDVNNPTVINIARFLQTLDNDANLANGIQITDAQSSLAAGKSVNFNQDTTAFENDGNVQVIVSTLTSASSTGAKNLILISAAQYNLQNALSGGSQPPINPTPAPTVYENTRRSGPVNSNEIWKGVIEITGDVTIFSPATVTIAPGSIIRFSAGSDDQQGEGTTPITDPYFPNDPPIAPSQMSSIAVFGGTLYAVGTPDHRITFTSSASQNAKPGDWHSLQYNKAGSKLILQYTTIEYGYYGIQVDDPASGSDITLKNNIITHIVACGVCTGYSGIDPARSVTITISDNDISYCGHEGVDTHSNANVIIENNGFHDIWNHVDGGGAGVIIDDNNSIIRNNQFLRNNMGINVIGPNSHPSISGNTFDGNWENYCWLGTCPYLLP